MFSKGDVVVEARDRCGMWLEAKVIKEKGEGDARKLHMNLKGWGERSQRVEWKLAGDSNAVRVRAIRLWGDPDGAWRRAGAGRGDARDLRRGRRGVHLRAQEDPEAAALLRLDRVPGPVGGRAVARREVERVGRRGGTSASKSGAQVMGLRIACSP
eukprot:451311-Prymnesium_polylepis.2